ncbi:MAG: DUF4239 domain-containing protein, partial [Gammaproteobacteria bacterium]|nr:DUF4239 domain-containing protein [Gammaproteobacteria bacterium]
MKHYQSGLLIIYSLLVAAVMGGFAYLISTIGLQVENSVFQVFFAIFGAMYAITTGFVLLVVLNNHSDVKNAVRLEVNSLRRMRDYLKYVDDQSAVNAIKRSMKTYCESVLKSEWPQMVANEATPLTTSPELHGLMDSVKKIDFRQQENAVVLSKIMDALSDLIVNRSERL